MAPRYSNVAVIGAGAAGISALRALHDEQAFETIRAFERRSTPGGSWNYDPVPQPFPGTYPSPLDADYPYPPTPSSFPWLTTPPVPEDVTTRTAMYSWLDTNIPADLMSFTHTPLPPINSFLSTERYGPGNLTRPYHVVARYLGYLADRYNAAISFNTTVESVEKIPSGKWRLTLRRREIYAETPQDSWWQEEFDAVIVATGQFNVPFIPSIDGLDYVVKSHPEALEHANAIRSPEQYTRKRVIVVGGSYSAGDIVGDISGVVRQPLYSSRRVSNPLLTEVWNLPGVETVPTIANIRGQSSSRVKVTFSDGSEVGSIDKIIFATGYRFSFPFLTSNPVTPTNRVTGFYQHLFNIGDPSLSIVGLTRGPLGFRHREYQSVVVARYYAGRGSGLPSQEDQERWERETVELKGDNADFHTIVGDMKEYLSYLRVLAGPPAAGTAGYGLPKFDDEWAVRWPVVLRMKDHYWRRVRRGETLRANI